MAQVFIPQNPRERAQPQRAVMAHETSSPARHGVRSTQRLGTIDLVIVLALLAALAFLITAAGRWTAPLAPSISIDLSPAVLPLYAGYSLLRMTLGYMLSLIFTLVYGHMAATHRRANMVMIPVLDILQSIPILSFLPAVLLALVAAFPHSNVGLELASVLLIFTSQAWNMTFSFYHAVRTQPTDLGEVATMIRLRPWQRFLRLELPSSMIGLIWNSMMSWAGGWFFLMASEQFTLGSRSFQLPGLGSYLQMAANTGNAGALLLGLVTLITLIVLLDLLFWRPLVAWADKFKVELSSGAGAPHSPVLDALRRSALLALVNRHVFHPLGRLIAQVLNQLQSLPDPDHAMPRSERQAGSFSARRIAAWMGGLLFGTLILVGLWLMVRLLLQVGLPTWGGLFIALLATWLRTVAALVIGAAWTVPLGVAIGLSPRWSRRLQPVVQVIASIPATALFPVLLLALVGSPLNGKHHSRS